MGMSFAVYGTPPPPFPPLPLLIEIIPYEDFPLPCLIPGLSILSTKRRPRRQRMVDTGHTVKRTFSRLRIFYALKLFFSKKSSALKGSSENVITFFVLLWSIFPMLYVLWGLCVPFKPVLRILTFLQRIRIRHLRLNSL